MTSSTTRRRLLIAGILACLAAVAVLVVAMLRHGGTSAGPDRSPGEATATEAEAVPGAVTPGPGTPTPDAASEAAASDATEPDPVDTTGPEPEPTSPRTSGDGAAGGELDAPERAEEDSPLRQVDPPTDVESATGGGAIAPDRLDGVTRDDRARQDQLADELGRTPPEAPTPPGAGDLERDAARLAESSRDPSFEAQLEDLE